MSNTKFTLEQLKSNSQKTFKDKLEDIWFDATLPFLRFKRVVRETYWKIRYAFQRMFKGYDNVDVFDLCYQFIDRYQKILKDFNNTTNSYPYGLSEHEWEDIINKMIYHLYYMDEDKVLNKLEKNDSGDEKNNWKQAREIMEKNKDEFFKLFSQYFYNLWD